MQGSLSTLQPPIYGIVSGNPLYTIPSEAAVKKGSGNSISNIKPSTTANEQKSSKSHRNLSEAKLVKNDRKEDSKPAASSPVKQRPHMDDNSQFITANGVHESTGLPLSRQASYAAQWAHREQPLSVAYSLASWRLSCPTARQHSNHSCRCRGTDLSASSASSPDSFHMTKIMHGQIRILPGARSVTHFVPGRPTLTQS